MSNDFTPAEYVGALLLGFRLGAGISRAEVARRARFSADTARRCERGDGSVRVDKIVRYGAACGVPLTFRFVVPDAEATASQEPRS